MTVVMTVGSVTSVCKVRRADACPRHRQPLVSRATARQDGKGGGSMQDEGVAKMNYMKSIAVVHFEHDSAPCSEYTGKQNLDEITFEAFKWHQQLQGNSDRRLYVLHAHTYFPYDTEDHKAKATKFRAAVQSQCEGMAGVKLSTISPKAAGPHPMPEFELAFTKYCLKDILPWLIFNRPDEYSILVHPFTSDVVADHDSSAMWLGKNLGADLQPLKDLQQQIHDEVKAGKDEDALLWPFVYAEINYQSEL